MGKKMSKAGMLARRAIRADAEAEPAIDHKALRSKHRTGENIIESALAKTVAEWDALIADTPEDEPASRPSPREPAATMTNGGTAIHDAGAAAMPGIAQGVIKFARKPAKMGTDYIFWVPRVYIKNGLVDPHVEYEVYLRKKT